MRIVPSDFFFCSSHENRNLSFPDSKRVPGFAGIATPPGIAVYRYYQNQYQKTHFKFYYLFLLILCNSINVYSQNTIPFSSIQERWNFADYLFCNGDYLRAASEYESVLRLKQDDTLFVRLGYCYLQTNNNRGAASIISKIRGRAIAEKLQGSILMKCFNDGDYPGVYASEDSSNKLQSAEQKSYSLISYFSRVLSGNIQTGTFQLPAVTANEKDTIEYLVKKVLEPEKLSKLKAAFLSTALPGAGKIYSGKTGDGITAFLITGLMTFLTVDNFKHNHSFRGYVFGVSALLFYGGNIYGSAVSAQLMNEENERSARNQLVNYVKLNESLHPETFKPGSVCR